MKILDKLKNIITTIGIGYFIGTALFGFVASMIFIYALYEKQIFWFIVYGLFILINILSVINRYFEKKKEDKSDKINLQELSNIIKSYIIPKNGRGFEKVSLKQYIKDATISQSLGNCIEDEFNDIKLPRRATKKSAGYDLYSPFSFELKPNETIKVPLGIKSYMLEDEELNITIRSNMGFKYNIRLLNQVGKIDADYHNNPDNEGHLFIGLKNEGEKTWIVQQGDAIGQGSFYNYLLADNDCPVSEDRVGGLGSTSK